MLPTYLAALSVSEHLASVAHRILRFALDRFLFATRLLIKSQACVLVTHVCISNPGQTFGASLADDVFNIPFKQMLHRFQLYVRSAAIVRHLHEHLYFLYLFPVPHAGCIRRVSGSPASTYCLLDQTHLVRVFTFDLAMICPAPVGRVTTSTNVNMYEHVHIHIHIHICI